MSKRKTIDLEPLLSNDSIGLEAGVSTDEHQSIRLWLRLLSCSTDIETEIRKRLRTQFGMTLARFDYLAQLHRHPEGLRMNVLSRNLMVTGGNVTGLTDELEQAGFVSRTSQQEDRRSFLVCLTAKGRRAFEKIAQVHEGWVVELLGGLGDTNRAQLYELLGQLRVQVSNSLGAEAAEKAATKSADKAEKKAANKNIGD